MRLLGELNVAAIERALDVIVARHEALRSTVEVIDGTPHAVIHESWSLPFKKIDLSALPPVERKSELKRLSTEEMRVPYDLSSEVGIRVTLFCLGPREHVFLLMTHHMVFDWASLGIFYRELSALYASFTRGAQVQLPDFADPFRRLCSLAAATTIRYGYC